MTVDWLALKPCAELVVTVTTPVLVLVVRLEIGTRLDDPKADAAMAALAVVKAFTAEVRLLLALLGVDGAHTEPAGQ
jgi:hypothetical protein